MHTLLRAARLLNITCRPARTHPSPPPRGYFGSSSRSHYSVMAENSNAAKAPGNETPKDNGTREVKILMLHGKMSLSVPL